MVQSVAPGGLAQPARHDRLGTTKSARPGGLVVDSTRDVPAEPARATDSGAAEQPQVKPRAARPARPAGQIVLVFQGGGALGAYQAGVYQALHEQGIEPDWIIGTSIGAINASLIAGNNAADRLQRLEEFWRRVQKKEIWNPTSWSARSDTASYWSTVLGGIPGFFAPNPLAFCGPHARLGPDHAGIYSTAPLKQTLDELVDFSLMRQGKPRLTVGAAHVRTSQMRYFDSRQCAITARHIMASGALPPAFPAVRIDGELHWDGGILSNTPTEVVFEDNPRRDSLIFAVHVWNPMGPEPGTIWEVLNRQKDIQYSSRVVAHIARERQVHKLRRVVSELVRLIPESERDSDLVQSLAGYGCITQMHVVLLLAPRLDNENHTKDIDFSGSGIRARWEAGHRDTARMLERAPWQDEVDPLEGVIVHEPAPDNGARRLGLSE
jgi:NTE family protein